MKIPTIGILGGGQLARMTSYAAFRFGFRVAIFERHPDSPAAQLTPLSVVGEWHDRDKQAEFARLATLITLENEFIEAEHLAQLEQFGTPVLPSAHTIARIQDKLTQKETLAKVGLPVPAFRAIGSEGEAEKFGEEFGYPFLLKARQGGYDGYGNRTVHSAKEIPTALSELGFPKRRIMAEAFVPFQKELAIMVARSRNGEMVVYPVVETVQENHICKIVKAPAPVESHISKQAADLAREAILAIDGVGIFGVEMFLTASGVLINELAPRPHNSGHYTIEACVTSQFENHLRAILGYPLGCAEMLTKAAVMVNLLGKRNAPLELDALPAALCHTRAKVHIYGKKEVRVGRKMGHITVVGESLEVCLQEAETAALHLQL